jgi:hypothetical protein
MALTVRQSLSAHQFFGSPKTGERIQVRNIFSPVIESITYRHVSKEAAEPLSLYE